jgi:type VI secretion system secreted protein Hcp
MEPTAVPGRRSRRARPFLVTVVALLVVVLAFAVVARSHDGPDSSSEPPPAVTLDAALAAFGGATDLFLKLPGIDGSSTNARHENEIDIADVSWSLSNATGTPAAATLSDITMTKGIDVASPKLLSAAAAGTTFFAATLTAEKPGSTPFTFVQLNLFGVRVASITQTANRASGFDEKIALRAGIIQLVYTTQKADGTKGPSVIGCWNLASHTAC